MARLTKEINKLLEELMEIEAEIDYLETKHYQIVDQLKELGFTEKQFEDRQIWV